MLQLTTVNKAIIKFKYTNRMILDLVDYKVVESKDFVDTKI